MYIGGNSKMKKRTIAKTLAGKNGSLKKHSKQINCLVINNLNRMLK